ncbi:glutathione S-transferase [Curvibacter sp. APW13]|uniref:glutathione S-transferase family protein n=1 Tax=Curvibacter sp. APW13 TaxID=3077236 RepID=UPI0028DE3870|nr:glutathione S-transferase [Curvibacter sp. APW13]MDT8993058.1 glutathione S-transferase [Curvibacter sp. APW13]
MLHLWGRITSINVRKVVWAVQECGVPFERTDAGRQFGIVDTPAYQALNPNALVPTLQDGDLVLWESNVIVRYLCAKYGAEGLYPADLAARFDAERWMDWQQTTLNRAGGQAFYQWIRTAPEQRDMAAIAASVAATVPLLRQLDAHLQRQPFMAGQHFTMADIPIACEVHRWVNLPQPTPHLPALERWYQQVSTRPATRGVLDIPLA